MFSTVPKRNIISCKISLVVITVEILFVILSDCINQIMTELHKFSTQKYFHKYLTRSALFFQK